MFLISIYSDGEAEVDTSSVAIKINGQPQILRRAGDHLLYNGNRCEVLVAANPDSSGEMSSDVSHERLIEMIVELWDSRGTCAAVDAVQDLLETDPEFCAPLIRAVCRLSRWWTEQIACDLLGIENEERADFTGLAKALQTATQDFADVEEILTLQPKTHGGEE